MYFIRAMAPGISPRCHFSMAVLLKDIRVADRNADEPRFCPDLNDIIATLEGKVVEFDVSNAAHWSSLECFLNDSPDMSDHFSIFEQIYFKCQQVLATRSVAPEILSVVLCDRLKT
jgi:hypothetical protein